MVRYVVALVTTAALVIASSAAAWTWPLGGKVLQPYSLGSDPYAAGQHRGIDVAGAAGEPVRAPAGGTVSFAGVVPSQGKTVTIQFEGGGFAVSLTHLAEISVSEGAVVNEGDPVGTAGVSGGAEWSEPYVHLGIRTSPAADGYVDPLTLLPPRGVPRPPAPPPAPAPVAEPPVARPAPGSAPAPVTKPPAPSATPAPTPGPVTVAEPPAASAPVSAPAPVSKPVAPAPKPVAVAKPPAVGPAAKPVVVAKPAVVAPAPKPVGRCCEARA